MTFERRARGDSEAGRKAPVRVSSQSRAHVAARELEARLQIGAAIFGDPTEIVAPPGVEVRWARLRLREASIAEPSGRRVRCEERLERAAACIRARRRKATVDQRDELRRKHCVPTIVETAIQGRVRTAFVASHAGVRARVARIRARAIGAPRVGRSGVGGRARNDATARRRGKDEDSKDAPSHVCVQRKKRSGT